MALFRVSFFKDTHRGSLATLNETNTASYTAPTTVTPPAESAAPSFQTMQRDEGADQQQSHPGDTASSVPVITYDMEADSLSITCDDEHVSDLGARIEVHTTQPSLWDSVDGAAESVSLRRSHRASMNVSDIMKTCITYGPRHVLTTNNGAYQYQ